MGMKKYKLSEIADKEFYHDEYGWTTPDISVKVSGNVVVLEQRYVNGRYETVGETRKVKDLGVDSVSTLLRGYGGGHHSLGKFFYYKKLTKSQVLTYEWDKEELYYYDGRSNVRPRINDIKVKFLWKDKEVTKNTEVEAYIGEKTDRCLLPWEVKKGLCVQYGGQVGTFVITKVFEQPNRENKLCIVERLIEKEGEENSFVVNVGDSVLTTVPYERYEKAPDEISVFNQPLNEPDLAAFSEYLSGSVNLYWRPIEEAGGYTVSLYKQFTDPYRMYKHKFYLLERYSVERNRHWLTIDNLIGKDYVAVIEAEDRSGEVIARTRGIVLDKGASIPQWFSEV